MVKVNDIIQINYSYCIYIYNTLRVSKYSGYLESMYIAQNIEYANQPKGCCKFHEINFRFREEGLIRPSFSDNNHKMINCIICISHFLSVLYLYTKPN